MAFHWHPLAFGLMIVVAVGTAAYTLWNGRQRQQTYDHFQSQTHEFTYREEPLTIENKERKRRDRSRDLCSICLDALKGTVRQLTCGHVFHVNCIDKWVISNETCPNCRKNVA